MNSISNSPAKTSKKYLDNPFNHLYEDTTEVSNRSEIQETIEYALGLEDKISGDFAKDLHHEIFEFRYNRLAFVRNGLIAAKIKFWKLYKDIGDGTFASFCKEHLHISRWQINDLITSARVVLELIYQGFEILPTNISQAIALKNFTGEELFHAWTMVVENISPCQITHKSIANLLFPPTEDDKAIATIKLPATLHEQVHREAATQGWSIPQLILAMLGFFVSGGNSHLFDPEEIDPNCEEKWQKDLINLIEEQDRYAKPSKFQAQSA